MQGFPPPHGARPTLETWDLAPFNRWTFQNVRRVLPTEAIARGEGPPSPLPAAPGGRIAALGIFGQMIWIDPADQLVVVSLASWPDYLEPDRRAAMFRACQAIGKALNA